MTQLQVQHILSALLARVLPTLLYSR